MRFSVLAQEQNKMNVYTVYADVKEGIDARTFVANMKLFLDKLPTMHDLPNHKNETRIPQYGLARV